MMHPQAPPSTLSFEDPKFFAKDAFPVARFLLLITSEDRFYFSHVKLSEAEPKHHLDLYLSPVQPHANLDQADCPLYAS